MKVKEKKLHNNMFDRRDFLRLAGVGALATAAALAIPKKAKAASAPLSYGVLSDPKAESYENWYYSQQTGKKKQLWEALKKLPRVKLNNLFTPLYFMKNLTQELGGPQIFVKRDDTTCIGMGGNKSRKLEYLMGIAMERGCDYVVTGAGFNSNWLTQCIASANVCGMKGVTIVKSGPFDGYDPVSYTGNHLLHYLMGAEIIVNRTDRTGMLEAKIEELEKMGYNVYYATSTGSDIPGPCGYAHQMLETLCQAEEMGIKITHTMGKTGSLGTQAGMILGARFLDPDLKVIGVSGGTSTKERLARTQGRLLEKVAENAELLGIDVDVSLDDCIVNSKYNKYGGDGLDLDLAKTIKMGATLEGIFCDPHYTGKTLHQLVGLVKEGYFKKSDVVLFEHFGGLPYIFAYGEALQKANMGLPYDELPGWVTGEDTTFKR